MLLDHRQFNSKEAEKIFEEADQIAQKLFSEEEFGIFATIGPSIDARYQEIARLCARARFIDALSKRSCQK